MLFDLRKGSDQELKDIRDACIEILEGRDKERGVKVSGYKVQTEQEYRAFLLDVRSQSLETLKEALAALERSNQFKDPDYIVKHKAIRSEIVERAKWGGRKPYVRQRIRRVV